MSAIDTIDDSSIALCLSGGGFRATLFHLGVIRALRDHRIGERMALQSVREIYAVSGGSILAAHMLRNYDRYVGTDAQFDEVSRELKAFADRDIRNRIMRRWLVTGLFGGSRQHWLQQEYAHKAFLGNATLAECYAGRDDLPMFAFLTTSFNTGELCAFAGTRFERTARQEQGIVTHCAGAGRVPLAFAVAASSAFPVAFPPLELHAAELDGTIDNQDSPVIELADGGVYDNLGVDKYCLAQRAAGRPAMVIVSNAGAPMKVDARKRYGGVFSRNVRATDVMMRRVGENTLDHGQRLAGDGHVEVKISALADGADHLDVATQRLLRQVRTDLDRFSAPLARALESHGNQIARSKFASRNWLPRDDAPAPTAPFNQRQMDEAVAGATDRSHRALLLDFRDWLWTGLLWLLIALLAGAAVLAVVTVDASRKAASEAQQQEDTAKRNEAVARGRLQARQQFGYEIAGDIEELETLVPQENIALRAAIDRINVKLNGQRTTDVEQTTADIDAPAAIIVPPASFQPQPAEVRQFPQLIYIQFAGRELTRTKITSLNRALREAGWDVQGGSGERIVTAQGRNQIRYSGDNRAAAEALARDINNTMVDGERLLAADVEVVPVRIIGRNILEVWISR